MTLETAAIADPPQIAVPTLSSRRKSRSNPSTFPTMYAAVSTMNSVPSMTGSERRPPPTTSCNCRLKPRRMMESCSSCLLANLIPGASPSPGLRTTAMMTPSTMPNTGPPTSGTSRPSAYARIATARHNKRPGSAECTRTRRSETAVEVINELSSGDPKHAFALIECKPAALVDSAGKVACLGDDDELRCPKAFSREFCRSADQAARNAAVAILRQDAHVLVARNTVVDGINTAAACEAIAVECAEPDAGAFAEAAMICNLCLLEARVHLRLVGVFTRCKPKRKLRVPVAIAVERANLQVFRHRIFPRLRCRQDGTFLDDVSAFDKSVRVRRVVPAPCERSMPHAWIAGEELRKTHRPAKFIANARRTIEYQEVSEVIAGVARRMDRDRIAVLANGSAPTLDRKPRLQTERANARVRNSRHADSETPQSCFYRISDASETARTPKRRTLLDRSACPVRFAACCSARIRPSSTTGACPLRY